MSISWIEIQPLSGYGDGSLNITVPINRNESRTCTIEVYSENITRTINITQNEYVIPTGLTVTPNPVVFPSTGGTVSVTLTAENDWVWVDWPDWVGISGDYYKGGSAGTHVIGLTALSNNTDSDNTGEFSIKSGDEVIYFSVEQPYVKITISVSPSFIDVPKEGGEYELEITSNGYWSVTAPDWVTLSSTSGNGDGIIKVTVDENTNIYQLIGDIVFVTNNATSTVDIIQDASPNYNISSVDAIYLTTSDNEDVNILYYSATATFASYTVNDDPTVHSFNRNNNYMTHNFATAGLNVVHFNLNSGVNSIGDYSFRGCTNLYAITIPNGINTIGSAFWECAGLTTVNIPNTVTLIDASAFYYCRNLPTIEIPNSVTEIGHGAFRNCWSLTTVEIPNSITKINGEVFGGCESLTSIEIPNTVTSIGDFAFSGCIRLRNFTIPDSVTSIGTYAFAACSALTSVIIPNKVTRINSYTFNNCSHLTTVTIPNSVTLIDVGAFWGCSSLTSITCYAATEPEVSSSTFEGVASNGTLHYPSGSDYSSWLSTSECYLGYYNWTGSEI